MSSSINRLRNDAVLARRETEKRIRSIKAWEESEKARVENKFVKKIFAISAWEKAKEASMEADLKKMEAELDKKKTNYSKKLKNKIATLHKKAEEKIAIVEAKRCEDDLKVDERATIYRALRLEPKKRGCFFGFY